MPELRPKEVSVDSQRKLARFFGKVSRAASRFLLLDYDGTLAPFHVNRRRAIPYPGLVDLLERIRTRTNTHLAIVSGRPSKEVSALIGLRHVEIWGDQGLERFRADGRHELVKVDEQIVQRISEARTLLRKEGLADLLENKYAALAIHWRGLESIDGELKGRVDKVWSLLSSRRGLRLMEFDHGVEIRAATRNKGDVVRSVLAEAGAGAAIAYLGDDRTDEDAFAALQGFGLGILVHQNNRPTVADVWIRPPDGVRMFLSAWLASCEDAK